MHHAPGMRGDERVGDLQPDFERALDGEGTPGEHGREGFSLDVLHDDVGVGVDVEDVVDRRDVGVREAAGRTGFAMQAFPRIGGTEERL